MEILLKNNYRLIIDAEDFNKISRFNLRLTENKKGHKICKVYLKEAKIYKYVHQIILGEKRAGEIAHFKDGNRLNCKKNNVSYIPRKTYVHMSANVHKRNSKYRGVVTTYVARIKCNGKLYTLGTYKNPTDAALAYNLKAIEMFGEEFAELNNLSK